MNPPQALVGSGSPSRTSTRIGDRVFRSAVKAASADTQGFAGLEDEVDHHWRRLFTAAALSTLLGVGAELGAANNDSAILMALRRGSTDTGCGTPCTATRSSVVLIVVMIPTISA